MAVRNAVAFFIDHEPGTEACRSLDQDHSFSELFNELLHGFRRQIFGCVKASRFAVSRARDCGGRFSGLGGVDPTADVLGGNFYHLDPDVDPKHTVTLLKDLSLKN